MAIHHSSAATPTDNDRYAAISYRDAAFDGSFFYGVQTTGVYCRPSCAARRALRRNVSFHFTCEAAERAGFRACKRCRPNEPSQQERYAELVRRPCLRIDQAEEAPPLETVAPEVGVSPFHRGFKQVTGVIPKGHVDARGAARLQDGLISSESITGAIDDAGFNAPIAPCHRVVNAAGTISGYCWGVSRKRKLIEMERAA